MAKRLKIEKRTLKRHKMQKTARHGLAFSEEGEGKVQQFYLDSVSRRMPNAKDMKYSDGKRQPVSKHVLMVTQQEGLRAFKGKHP